MAVLSKTVNPILRQLPMLSKLVFDVLRQTVLGVLTKDCIGSGVQAVTCVFLSVLL